MRHSMKKIDKFANIAANSLFAARDGLIVPHVRKPFDRALTAQQAGSLSAYFTAHEDPAAEVKAQMQALEEQYRPFLQDLSPASVSQRERLDFPAFDWRIATPEDGRNFAAVLAGAGNWEQVTIPHFRDPIGKAETIYRTTFSLSALPAADRCAYLHFDGVDYIAHAYLNGKCLGSHEGLFGAFEFDCTDNLVLGENVLVVCVENDFIHMGNSLTFGGEEFTGDKLYAATGPGFNDPEIGWHHCPAGMGIFQPVYLEYRARVYISDIFVRPLCEQHKAEIYVEVYNADVQPADVKLNLSVCGKNFEATVVNDLLYSPETIREAPLGDTVEDTSVIHAALPLLSEKGVNYYCIPVDMGDFRWWSPAEPWLYRVEVQAVLSGAVIDTRTGTFGMRSFTMDTESDMKGMMYLNGKKIRLRGANTMGFEQQDVMKGDYEQLIYDLLLTKACNMNYLRISQRPVQDVILDYCDALGVMVQTDLPLFGALRRNKFAEAVKQAEEMERLVRKHPAAIMDSYINENAPNGRNKPHRNMSREELMSFFDTADHLVKFWNPDRVIKHIEGDFDPPTSLNTLTDNHAYTFWYNGQGLDAGEFIKGDWVPVKPGWYYACGEFGGEGLDPADLMYRHYPYSWLPHSPEEEYDWTPDRITASQTGFAHYCFFETPHTVKEWVRLGQRQQLDSVKIMTEAFRRNADMVSFAVHFFIDAFPAAWMKAIVDYERTPKPAFYAYRDALNPVIVSLRTDRLSYFTGETVKTELWACNDRPETVQNARFVYEAACPDGSVYAGTLTQTLRDCNVDYLGEIEFPLPDAEGIVTLYVAIFDEAGTLLHKTSQQYTVFRAEPCRGRVALLAGGGPAAQLLQQLQLPPVDEAQADVILIDDYDAYQTRKCELDALAQQGKQLIFYCLQPGEYRLGDKAVAVKHCSMGAMHFVSRDTGHCFVDGFGPDDFKWWYSDRLDRITPILDNTFTAEAVTPILLSGNTDDEGRWGKALAAAEFAFGKGGITLCQLKLDDHVKANPVAEIFAARLLK